MMFDIRLECCQIKEKNLNKKKKRRNTTAYHLLCPCTSVLQWHFINVCIYLINMLRCDIYGIDVSLTTACWARLKVNFNVLSKHNGKCLKGCTFVIVNISWCGHVYMCLLSMNLYFYPSLNTHSCIRGPYVVVHSSLIIWVFSYFHPMTFILFSHLSYVTFWCQYCLNCHYNNNFFGNVYLSAGQR